MKAEHNQVYLGPEKLGAKLKSGPHTYLVPNGVNSAGYQQQLRRGAPVPPELAAVPRFGYLGQIGSRLDFEWLVALAAVRPDWSLVFVGSQTSVDGQVYWERLRGRPYVYHLCAVSGARGPEYVCAFDVGLMPYRYSEHARFIDPLKLYDYLAAWLPIASIDLPALEGCRHLVYVGDTPAEFMRAVEAALRDTNPAAAEERRRVAAANSCERRVETLAALIQAYLPDPPRPLPETPGSLEPEPAGDPAL